MGRDPETLSHLVCGLARFRRGQPRVKPCNSQAIGGLHELGLLKKLHLQLHESKLVVKGAAVAGCTRSSARGSC